MSKILVAYFSASGITKSVAKNIADLLKADIFEIVPKQQYTKEDLDWTNEKSRTTLEANDKSFLPQMANSCDISAYDIIFIGFPIWWYRAPNIINTFLESANFDFKTIVPFCTSGGSPIGHSAKYMQISAPNAKFLEGRQINFGESKAVLRRFIQELGIEI